MKPARSPELFDVVVIGAGAAGMMAAAEAGARGRRVLVIDHATAAGEKIRISGGGRCNFTNLRTAPDRFLSQNPRFAASALSLYTAADFLALVESRRIAWHEKTLGQLFCDGSAAQIVDLLLDRMRAGGVVLRLNTSVTELEKTGAGFRLIAGERGIACRSVVLATGGKSIPKMGATGFAYEAARRFGLRVTETRPALVPLTFEIGLLETLKPLAGVATDARIRAGRISFDEAMLFTHRGLSGPAVLQVSSYWREGEEIEVDMAPGQDAAARLLAAKRATGKLAMSTVLSELLPRRLAQSIVERTGGDGSIGGATDARLKALGEAVNRWRVKPVGSEGYRTAEVTLGGVDTRDLNQRTLEARDVPGLYVVGEAVDVTGWLGGYNFQWAWASGWCAGQEC